VPGALADHTQGCRSGIILFPPTVWTNSSFRG